MLLTPPDVFSQTLLALPMWFLFEIGVIFGGIIQKERADKEANDSAAEDGTDEHKPPVHL
jgi:sec-independent protein translocase protein TatC